MNKSGLQRDYMVEINEAITHEEIKSSNCQKTKFQKSFETPYLNPHLHLSHLKFSY